MTAGSSLTFILVISSCCWNFIFSKLYDVWWIYLRFKVYFVEDFIPMLCWHYLDFLCFVWSLFFVLDWLSSNLSSCNNQRPNHATSQRPRGSWQRHRWVQTTVRSWWRWHAVESPPNYQVPTGWNRDTIALRRHRRESHHECFSHACKRVHFRPETTDLEIPAEWMQEREKKTEMKYTVWK